MKYSILIFALLAFLNTACQIKSKIKPADTLSATNAVDTLSAPADTGTNSFDKKAIRREKGLLKSIEDGGYPFVSMTIEFPEKKLEESFTLNLEETKGIDQAGLYKSKGKYLDFSYTSQIMNALLDLKYKNKTILDGEAGPQKAVLKQVTGVLSGADQETLGDLPGTLSITTKENQKLDFDFFITSGIVKYNGKIITAFYEERTNNKIVDLKIVP
jgi:hypothetical protein